MKKVIIFLILLNFGINQTNAKCKSYNITVFPSAGAINLNSIFVIEGYGTSQNVIQNLNNKYKVYLKSDNTVVLLQVMKIYNSQYGKSQALLKPTIQLLLNKTYTLYIDSLDQIEKEDFYRKDYKWTVNNKKDTEMPLWIKKPVYKSKHKIEYGCGSNMYVNFCVCINDVSPVLVFTRLKEMETGQVSEYFVAPDSSSLSIGHGMCYGDFRLKDGENYQISFSLMDASGNVNDTLTKSIEFVSPTDEDQDILKEKISCQCPKVNRSKENSINIIIVISILSIIGFTCYRHLQKGSS